MPCDRVQVGCRVAPVGLSQAAARSAGSVAVSVAASLAASFAACVLLVSSAANAQPLSDDGTSVVRSISLERGCAGCADGSLLVLQRDGTASLTLIGNARHGTADRISHGTLKTEEFQALARLALSRRFFELNDAYADRDVLDGPWTTTRIVGDGSDKQVFSRDDAGPADLKAINEEIDRLKSKIRFVAD